MVVRRIREHAAAQNWFAIGIDVLIVVVGVVVGTQVNNWNAERIARVTGQTYRARLIDDLRSNETDMIERQIYYRDVRRHAQAALEAFEGPPSELGEAFLIDAYQASQFSPDPTKRFTYDEMLAVGATDSLGNTALRERIANYYVGMATVSEVTAEVPRYRERLRRTMPYLAQQRVRSNCAETYSEDAVGVTKPSLPENCMLGLPPDVVSSSVAQLRAEPELRRDLTRHLVDLDTKLSLFRDIERRARQLRAIMEAKRL